MAEIFSLVVGALDIPQVALQAQALFESRQRKQRRAEAIRERIADFRRYVESIERDTSGSPPSRALIEALAKSEILLQKLNQSINDEHEDSEQCFPCLKWSRRRRKSKSANALLEHGEELEMAHQRLRDALPLQINLGIRCVTQQMTAETSYILSAPGVDLPADFGDSQCQTYERLETKAVAYLEPAGILEISPSFRPASCTVEDGVMNLFSVCNRETSATRYTRVDQCGLFYRRDSKFWIRISLTITTTIQSIYWNLGRVNSEVQTMKGASVLPKDLTHRLESFLKEHGDIDQDDQVTIYLSGPSDVDANRSLIEVRPRNVPCQAPHVAHLRRITEHVRHWNVPWYWDSDLDHRPARPSRPDSIFFVYLNDQDKSRWLMESRFGCDTDEIECIYHILKVSHLTRDLDGNAAPGINPLAGVVCDKGTGLIAAMLSEIPAGGRLSRIIVNADPPIPWSRRLKWCQQIVQGVSAMHDKECFAGGLFTVPDWTVAVDRHDNAVLYRFWPKFFRNSTWAGAVPPEHRINTPGSPVVYATAATDLFQLGMLLWRISGGHNRAHQGNFCQLAGCTAKASSECLEPHGDPVQLSSVEPDTPDILTAVIAACRAENPQERPPARELLKWMQDADQQTESAQAVTDDEQQNEASPLKNLEDCIAVLGQITSCSICGRLTEAKCFHCHICCRADFDLCVRCFSENGLHCFDNTHYLRELVRATHYTEAAGESRKAERWYTNVKENGKREVIVR